MEIGDAPWISWLGEDFTCLSSNKLVEAKTVYKLYINYICLP